MRKIAVLVATLTLILVLLAPAAAQEPAKPLVFDRDVLPMFTEDHVWFEGSLACTSCHFGNLEKSMAEFDMSSYEAIMIGADRLSEPEPEKIVLPNDWEESVLRRRMRNPRMPPGWHMVLDESNRNGPCLEPASSGFKPKMAADGSFTYGKCDAHAVGLIGAWVMAGAKETEPFEYAGQTGLTFGKDVLPFFTETAVWHTKAEACTECHMDNTEKSKAEMDLTSYAGIMLGAEVISEAPGEAIVVPGDWEHSILRLRLRNNRMPPGWMFDDEGANRNGPMIKHPVSGKEVPAVTVLEEWVTSGAAK